MTRRQIISGTKPVTPKDPHDVVTSEMLRQRGADQSYSLNSGSLHRVIQIRKQIQALSGEPGTSIPGVSTPDVPIPPHALLTRAGASIWPLLRETSIASTNFQRAAVQVLSGWDAADIVPDGMLQHALTTYAQLLSWPQRIPEDWKYRVFAPDASLGLGLDAELEHALEPDDLAAAMPRQFYLFSENQRGAMWIAYWCSCIHLGLHLLHNYHFFYGRPLSADGGGLDLSILPTETEIWEQLLMTVGDICASAPYLLGDIDEHGQLNIGGRRKAMGGFFLLRGLAVANGIENLPLPIRRMLLDYLGRVGYAMGIGKAARRREEWLAAHPVEAVELLRMTDK
jgi:hypothetical protein